MPTGPGTANSPGEALLIVSPSNHTDQFTSTWPITRIA
jgi:hypothetical protein